MERAPELDEAALRKPIYLFADSQLLFWRQEAKPFFASVLQWVDTFHPKAAYLGASNGDQPEFFEIFKTAAHGIGIQQCHHVHAQPDGPSRDYLRQADIVLLAGGDVRRGWNAFCDTHLREIIQARHEAGAVLIGISAGAMQLGAWSWDDDTPTRDNVFQPFSLVPAVISVHEEAHWPILQKAMTLLKDKTPPPGLGIPSGGGVIYHSNGTFESLRYQAKNIT